MEEVADEAEEGEEGEVEALDRAAWWRFFGFSFMDLAKHLGLRVKIPDFQTNTYSYKN